MVDDFLIMGAASCFMAMYFAPNSPKKKMMKSLRSDDREKALKSIQNEAWDMTYLSNVTKQIKDDEENKYRYIFVTSDQAMSQFARLLLASVQNYDDYRLFLLENLKEWWGGNDAQILADKLINCHEMRDKRGKRSWLDDEKALVQQWTEEEEAKIRAWASDF